MMMTANHIRVKTTRTGKRFHRPDCPACRRTVLFPATPSNVSGLTPCRVCRPYAGGAELVIERARRPWALWRTDRFRRAGVVAPCNGPVAQALTGFGLRIDRRSRSKRYLKRVARGLRLGCLAVDSIQGIIDAANRLEHAEAA